MAGRSAARMNVKCIRDYPASPLPLFMGRIGTDHPHHAFPPHNLAVTAHLLDGRPYFHRFSPDTLEPRGQRGNPMPPVRLAFFNRLSYWCDINRACTWAMKSMHTTTTISSEVPPK